MMQQWVSSYEAHPPYTPSRACRSPDTLVMHVHEGGNWPVLHMPAKLLRKRTWRRMELMHISRQMTRHRD